MPRARPLASRKYSAAGDWRARRPRRRGDAQVQPRGDLEAVLAQADRILEQRRPGQPAVPAMGHFQHAQQARCSDRQAAVDRGGKSQRPPVAIEELVRRGAGRRGLAAVERAQRIRCTVEMEQEPAAADAGRLGLDDIEHHLRGDRRVDRTAAAGQRAHAGVHGVRVRGGDHVASSVGDPLREQAGRGLRRSRHLLAQRRRHLQRRRRRVAGRARERRQCRQQGGDDRPS